MGRGCDRQRKQHKGPAAEQSLDTKGSVAGKERVSEV